MKLWYAGTCRLCGVDVPARAEAIYERETKTVRCVNCGVPPAASSKIAPQAAQGGEAPPFAGSGVAGSSARREYKRRKAKDEDRIRVKWGRLGGIAVALSDERQSTTAWQTGAVGEERLGARLDSLASPEVAVLHDRRIPGTKANIDHVVVTRSGIWVIDAKHYKGRPALQIEAGLLRPRVEKLLVGRRDCTKLVDGALKQVELVRDLVGDVPVTMSGKSVVQWRHGSQLRDGVGGDPLQVLGPVAVGLRSLPSPDLSAVDVTARAAVGPMAMLASPVRRAVPMELRGQQNCRWVALTSSLPARSSTRLINVNTQKEASHGRAQQ